MTDDDLKAVKEKALEIIREAFDKVLYPSAPAVEVEDFDPNNPTTIRMKLTYPVPWIGIDLAIEDPKEDSKRLRAEIAAAKMLEHGEWRPFRAAAVLLKAARLHLGVAAVTDIPGPLYQEILKVSYDPVKWARRVIENGVEDPAELYYDEYSGG